jgi:hypothetical protein
MKNEVSQHFKFLRFYTMTEKQRVKKPIIKKYLENQERITNDVCNKHTLSKIVPAANYRFKFSQISLIL